MNRILKFVENLQFVVLALLIIGQVTLGDFYLFGQGTFLIANVVSLIRDFVLDRPLADKVKNFACTGITVGLILLEILK